MVVGVDKFREYFKDFPDSYVIIGGTACDQHFEEAGIAFRKTTDIDIILIVETLSREFVARFWEFVREGRYQQQQKGEQERKYYRFIHPANGSFPSQMELFSRNPDLLDLAEDSHLTPIPIDEELSSLSAILMNEGYYHLTIKESLLIDGVHVAKPTSLICLKAKAHLDYVQREDQGKQVDSRNLKKHKNDIFKLATLIGMDERAAVAEPIKDDIRSFLESVKDDLPDMKQLGINVPAKDILLKLHQVYEL